MTEIFDKDYFENGVKTGKSDYENYRWIPEMTRKEADVIIDILHLKKGDRVFIEMRLRGREKAFQNLAREKMKKFLESMQKLIPIKVERDIKRESRGLTIIIAKA